MTANDLRLTCPAFEDNGVIPTRHTCDGEDLAPPLAWSNLPEATRSLALIVDDPDAPRGTFTHWLLWDLSPEAALERPVDLTASGVAGTNDFGDAGYGGPCPPSGHGEHRYRFELHALDVESLELPEGASRDKLEAAIDGHVIGRAGLVGRYRRGGGA